MSRGPAMRPSRRARRRPRPEGDEAGVEPGATATAGPDGRDGDEAAGRRPGPRARLRAAAHAVRHPDPLAGVLAVVLLAGLALRLWSIDHGLPWAYNFDEELHFVPKAAGMLGGSLNPGYFENPPALTYLLYVAYRSLAGLGVVNVGTGFAGDPSDAYLVARVVVALTGTLVAGLAYWAGKRLFDDRRVGVVAAALLAFAFLPVFYSKLALNDVVTLVPVTVALVGCLLALERGRAVDWLLAGAAVGAATATKYTAGAMAVTVGVVALMRLRRRDDGLREAALGLVLAGVAASAVFLLLNPFSVLDFGEFRSQVGGQSATAGSSAKLGQEAVPGWVYYVWTMTWGLGAIPTIAAFAGAWLALRWDARRALLLVVFPVLLFLFLGAQARYFGRWLLPVYPMLALLAAFACVAAADRLPLGRRWRPVALAGLALLLAGQGLVAGVRVSATLGEADTRALAREWLALNVPVGSRVVFEPVFPQRFFTLGDRDAPERFRRYPTPRPYQAYERRLNPGVLDRYREQGYCTVVTGSHQKARGLKAGLPGAIDYYAQLEQGSDLLAVFSPWRPDREPPGFNFDLSFNWLPREHIRPGPLIEVRRLRDCRPRSG